MSTMHPMLDEEKQRLARLYEKEKRLLSLAGLFVSLLALLIFYFCGLSAYFAGLEIGKSILWPFLIYVFVFYAFLYMFGFSLKFYSGYVHEHRWGFSNHTLKSWLCEQAKSFLLGLFLLVLILSLLFWIMDIYPQAWWLIAAFAMTLVSVVFATLFPVLIAPIFNTYTPIENKELTKTLDHVLSQGGLKSSGFFREDMSRQTKKENAFLAGMGKTRRVVLGDNLIKNMSIPEIESIIAHEVGHYKHKHIWKNIFIGALQYVIVFFLADILMKRLFLSFLASLRWDLILLPVLVLITGALFFVFNPLNNVLSRGFERQADRYVLRTVKNTFPFRSALAGLANRNLSNAYPEWWVKFLYYSHPPISERLRMAEKYTDQSSSSITQKKQEKTS